MGDIKIAYFIDRLILGGTELQLVEQINRLEGNGFRQYLFCLYKSFEHDSIPLKCKTYIVNVHSLKRLETLKKVIEIVQVLKNEKVNIVQTYFFDSTFLGVLCGRFAGVEKVLTCRRDLGFWYTKWLLLVIRCLNLLSHLILVNSQAVKMNVMRREHVKNRKVHVIKNGIETYRYRFSREFKRTSRRDLGLEDHQTCIGIIANMSRQVKRIDLVIEAAKILSVKDPGIKFIIQGDGYLKGNLIDTARRYGLAQTVRFLDSSYNKDAVLAAMDIGMITSDSEGLSNSIMEYMAAGLPTVATRVGGNIELVEDGITGYLFKKGDAEALSKALLPLAKDSELRKGFSGNAIRVIQPYDWNRRIREMRWFYHNLLRLSNRPK